MQYASGLQSGSLKRYHGLADGAVEDCWPLPKPTPPTLLRLGNEEWGRNK